MRRAQLNARTVRLTRSDLIGEDIGDGAFLAHARAYTAAPFSAILLSGGTPPVDGENRYSIAACTPLMVFVAKGQECAVHAAGRTVHIQGAGLDVLDEVFESLRPDFPLDVEPFCGGAIGYFAYDLKNSIERLPQTACDDLHLPDILLMWPRQILIHDRLERKLHALEFSLDGSTEKLISKEVVGPAFVGEAQQSGSNSIAPGSIGTLRSNFSHEGYIEAVSRVRHYIRQGDVYQVNLSQRFQFPYSGDPFFLWRSLFDVNPAPFYAFIHAGGHHVLSTSMERFLHVREQLIETRPIKGTRKRGSTPEEDELLRRDLASDPKDDAELSMIVDLLRNDLGRICTARSIRVNEHKRIESYQNVHHLISIVTGRLEPGTRYGDILRATFPGGSITGCPKIRAMEIIDELEPNVRHVYTGSIGYLGWHGNMDLNIAIRTAIVGGGECYFSVGGGIVFDSKDEDEYQETLHKGRTLFDLIERQKKGGI